MRALRTPETAHASRRLLQSRQAASLRGMSLDLRARLEPLYRATDYCVEDARLCCTLRVDQLGMPALQAVGRSRNDAHHEPSLLVPGLSLSSTHALMRRFRQNAFLWFALPARRARLEWV